MTQNQEKEGLRPLEKKSVTRESCSTLYSKLVTFAKSYCQDGNYALEGFEVDIHTLLDNAITEDCKQFLQEVLPLLIETRWLPETATVEDVWRLFQRHDSWNDLDTLDDFFEETISKLNKITATSQLGIEKKTELVKLLERTQAEFALDLDFVGPFPMTSPSDHGNVPFRRLITDLYHAAYQKSTLIREFVR